MFPLLQQILYGGGIGGGAPGGPSVNTPPYFPGNPGADMSKVAAQGNFGGGASSGAQGGGFFDKADQFLQKPSGQFLLNLLAQEGYSTTPQSPLGAVGRAGLQTAQQQQQSQFTDLQRKLLESQIGLNKRRAETGTEIFGKINPSDFTPGSLSKFQRSNNFADLEIREDASSDPANVAEFKFFQSLSPDRQREYLKVKRANPPKDVAGAGFGAPDPVSGEFQVSVPESQIVAGEGERALAAGEGARGRVRTPHGGFEAVPGTEAARAEEEQRRQRGKGALMTSIQAQTVVEDIQRLNEQIDNMPFGRTAAFQESLSPMLQSDEFRNANALIESVKGNVGVDSLLRIKASGAGLGQVPQSQLDLLSRLLGELTLTQSKEQFVRTWNRMGDVYGQIWNTADAEMSELGMPTPDVFKQINSGGNGQQVGRFKVEQVD